MYQEPFLQEVDLKKPTISRVRKIFWSLGLVCASLGATVVGLSIAYASLKKDCSNSSSSSNSQSQPAYSTTAAAPEQFTAKNAIVTSLNGQNSTVDWVYDGLEAKESLTYVDSGVQFRRDYINGVSEMTEVGNVSETCTGFPMTKTSISTFEYETVSQAGGTFNALNESCRRFHAIRPDGSTFYFSRHEKRPEELCTLEIDGLEFRFNPLYFREGIDQNETIHQCPENHVGLTSVHVQHWHWHWHPSFHPGWLNPEHWWQKLKCTACTRGIGWVINKVEGMADGSICSETGPFASACLFALKDLENKVCQREECVSRACSAIHLC